MLIGQIRRGSQKLNIDSRLIGLAESSLGVWDNFSKSAVLTIISGYQKSNDIAVNANFSTRLNLRRFSSFLSYTLNFPIAPRIFDIKISLLDTDQTYSHPFQSNRELSEINAVLAFSGGLDSTAGVLYARDKGHEVLPLWVDFGQRNSRAEEESVTNTAKRLGIKPAIVKVDLNSYIMNGWKDWDFIIPGRNFLFLSLANSLLRSSTAAKKFVYLCAHKDEMLRSRNRDKSLYFFKQVSNLFSQDTGREIIATSPFARYSKTEVISYWRQHWEKKYRISPLDTITCYYGQHCGRCEACLKRSVNLLAAGYPARAVLDYGFSDVAGVIKEKWLPKIRQGLMSRNIKLDFIIALENNLAGAAPYVRNFYENLPSGTKQAVKRRKKEIQSVKLV